MFLPLVQRLTGYLATAGWGRFDRDFEVGDTPVVEVRGAIDSEAQWTVVAPDGSDALFATNPGNAVVRVDGASSLRAFAVAGAGESQPVASNRTRRGRAANTFSLNQERGET